MTRVLILQLLVPWAQFPKHFTLYVGSGELFLYYFKKIAMSRSKITTCFVCNNHNNNKQKTKQNNNNDNNSPERNYDAFSVLNWGLFVLGLCKIYSFLKGE